MLEKQRRPHKWCTPMDPTYGRVKAGQPARTYIQQLCADTGCSPEDLSEAMNDREKWREISQELPRYNTSIAAKIYNALLRNRIEHKIDNILRKNQNDFRRNRSTTSQILTIRRILEDIRSKNLQATILFVDLLRPSTPFPKGRWSKFFSPTAYQKKP